MKAGEGLKNRRWVDVIGNLGEYILTITIVPLVLMAAVTSITGNHAYLDGIKAFVDKAKDDNSYQQAVTMWIHIAFAGAMMYLFNMVVVFVDNRKIILNKQFWASKKKKA